MYQDEWGRSYKTIEEAKEEVIKTFSKESIASELYYHIDIDILLEWCLNNADFRKDFSNEIKNTVNDLCEDCIFEVENDD